jgi:hypothetical protein
MEPPQITTLPRDHEQTVVRIADLAGELDLCEKCQDHATVQLLVKALKATVGTGSAGRNARGGRGSRPSDTFDGTRSPCPFC